MTSLALRSKFKESESVLEETYNFGVHEKPPATETQVMYAYVQ